MSHSNQAVFLSYASQDAEAVLRIAEALRAAGVEVWFDQDELVGGDAWDAKIRKQIAECALFVPVISTHTQARLEGYFRLEWKLAAQRTHTMADEKTFLLPVVIDATRDPEAKVPAEFKAVQWTKLPGGETPPAFAERVKKLLGGEQGAGSGELEAGRPRPAERREGAASPVKRGPSQWWWVLPIFGVTMALVLVMKEGRKDPAPPAVPAAPSAAAEINRVRAGLRPDEWTRADFDAFVPVTDRLIQANPENGEAWALRSIAHSLLVVRNLDTGTKPLETGKDAADRARRLAPGSPLAELSLGLHLVAMISRGGDPLACRVPMDRALAGLPADENLTRYAELCSYWLGYQFEGTEKSARAWLAATPGASFPAWILAQSALVRRHPEEALKWAAQASADPEITGVRSFVTTFEVCYYLQADVAAAQAALDHVPISQRSVHRVLASRWLVAMAGKHFDQALQELNRAPEAMLRDRLYHGPKALLAGLANEAAGRRDVASAQFGEAEKILRTELTADPDNQELRAVLALSLACQGRSEEARRELAAVEPLLTGQDPTVYTGHLIALIAQVHGVLGEIDRMVPWLRILFTKPSQVPFTPASLRQDPRFGRYAAEPLLQAVLAEFTPAETAAPAAAAAARVDDKSVAVLAFANLSDDKANEYFSDGISEELLNVLAKVPGLKVTARTSSFHFKGKDTSVPEIARQLGVAYVIEGSVRKQGNKVRITAQLIKAADGFHVWSDTFTRELQDIFAVQDEIAGLIAQNFQLKLGAGNTSGDRSTNVEAWQLYLAGRRAWNLRTPEGYREAETLFQRAIALDGHLARAYAALADVWQIRAIDENAGAFSPQWRTLPTAIKSRALIDKALEIDPRCAEAHASLGLNLQLGWQDEPAMQAFRRAIELNPNYATAHQWLGLTLVGVGKMDEGLPEVKLAAELDPLSARILSDYAKALNFSGHPQEALVVSLRALAIQPGAVQAVLQEARALASLGRPMEGVALVEGTGKAGLSERMRLEALAILAAAAQPEAIRRLIGDVDALPASPLKFASLVALGRIDAALADPESSMAWDGWGLSEAAYGRLFEPIRGDARFQKMIETSGRADYFHRAQAWRAAHPPVNSTAKP